MSELFWKKTLADLEGRVSRPNYVTWLKPTQFIENRSGLIFIAVPNPYAKNWLEKNLLKELARACREEFPEFEEIRFEIRETKEAKPINHLPLLDDQEVASEKDKTAPGTTPTNSVGINSSYTFGNFVVGNNNRLAFAASQVVAEKPGEAYNPLFIYGGVGLGKTHLMHAIANEALERSPRKKVVYISCETFASEFVEALRTNSINEFKRKYRSIDILLVDDIQFLANKEGTQEEFFHTFNALHQGNRQIVVTADRVPKEINQLEDRLASRFGWGMIADIQSPNFESRVAILRSKTEERGLPIPNEAIEYIANTITTNVRELEGSLIKLAASASIDQEPVTKEYTARVLKDLAKTNDSRLTPKQIIKKVAEYFGIEVIDILGKKRNKEIVYPRQVAMYLIKERLNHSYPQIGDEFGGKDHTTVMHSVDKITTELKISPEVENDINSINKLFI